MKKRENGNAVLAEEILEDDDLMFAVDKLIKGYGVVYPKDELAVILADCITVYLQKYPNRAEQVAKSKKMRFRIN